LINNKEAATMGVTSCQLNNLLENKLYQIQVVAINVVTNFRSQSAPVFIETLPKPANQLQSNKTLPMITNNEVKVSRISQAKNFDSKSSKNNLPLYLEPEDVKANKSPESLNEYLLLYQNELRKVREEYEMNHDHLDQEIGKLNQELKFYKKEYEQETGSKIKKDINVKDLEKKRDNLTFQKSKIAKELKSLESMNDIYKSELNDLKNKVKKLTERKQQIMRYEKTDRLKIDRQITKVTGEIELLKVKNDEIEDVCKTLTAEKKEMSIAFNNLKPLVESFNSETIFNKEGNLTPKASEILEKLYNLQPTWANDITNEIYNSVNFEINWKSTFRSEIRKFLSIQHSYEIAKVNQDKNYQPVKMSEHQASIEFGGFSNALPKKPKRSFSPLASLQSPVNDENSNDQVNEWYNFYGQVYSNDSAEQLQSLPNQQQYNEQFEPMPSQGVTYDDTAYNQVNNGLLNSPIQEDALLQTDLLNQDLLTPNSLLRNNDSYFGFQSSLSNINTVWNSGIDTRMNANMNTNITNTNINQSNLNNGLSGVNSNINNPTINNPNISGLPGTNMSNSNSSLNFGLGNMPADLNSPYNDFNGKYGDLQTHYNDLNRLPYNPDINLFNPVLDRSVSSLNNKYFAPQNADVELNDTPTSTTSNNPILSPIGSLLSPPSHTTQHQKDFGNLWLDKPYTLHNRTVSGSNSQIWRNDHLGHSHNFNLQLFSSTPSLSKNESDLDLSQNT